MLHRYESMARDVIPADRTALIAHLDRVLPDLWQADYLAMPGSTRNLVTVTFGDDSRADAFCRYLFDHASDQLHDGSRPSGVKAEDRVAAVWGTSRREPSVSRDQARMRDFPKGVWPKQYDRGHFFAHTMGP
jgi:hypothetical protein